MKCQANTDYIWIIQLDYTYIKPFIEMDIFGDDIDTLLQNGDDEINENIANEENVENEDSENKDEKNRDSGANVVEPKKRVVRNPQVSLKL